MIPKDCIEIERKFLLSGIPDSIKSLSKSTMSVKQGYLPGEKIKERVSKRYNLTKEKISYNRTIKYGSGIERIELKEKLNEETFNFFWPLTKNKRIKKIRYRIPDEAQTHLTWEIDEFLDRKLYLLEIELISKDEIFQFPSWVESILGKEVTSDPAYEGFNLAC